MRSDLGFVWVSFQFNAADFATLPGRQCLNHTCLGFAYSVVVIVLRKTYDVSCEERGINIIGLQTTHKAKTSQARCET